MDAMVSRVCYAVDAAAMPAPAATAAVAIVELKRFQGKGGREDERDIDAPRKVVFLPLGTANLADVGVGSNNRYQSQQIQSS